MYKMANPNILITNQNQPQDLCVRASGKRHKAALRKGCSVLQGQVLYPHRSAHYGAQYERFENYFLNRDIIDFQLDGRPYSVFISTAICFPQAYAAIMPIYQRIHSYSKVAVLDIGGFTADYLLVKNGETHWITASSLFTMESNPRSMRILTSSWTSRTLMLS